MIYCFLYESAFKASHIALQMISCSVKYLQDLFQALDVCRVTVLAIIIFGPLFLWNLKLFVFCFCFSEYAQKWRRSPFCVHHTFALYSLLTPWHLRTGCWITVSYCTAAEEGVCSPSAEHTGLGLQQLKELEDFLEFLHCCELTQGHGAPYSNHQMCSAGCVSWS